MKNFNRAAVLFLFFLSGCQNFVKIDYRPYEKGKPVQAIIKNSHQGAVTCLAVTTDSRFIISGSFDKTVKIWLTDGTFVKSISTGSLVNAVAFNPNGNTIIAGLADKTIQIWTLDGVKLRTCTGHNAEITSLAVAPDGSFFVSASKDKTVKVWDPSGNLANNIQAHDDVVSAVKASSSIPFLNEIVSASWDGTIKVWSAIGDFLLLTIKDDDQQGNFVESIAVSRDGQYIAAGYSDGSIKLWSRSGTLIKKLVGHTDYVKSLAITKDNRTVISGSADNSIIIWNTNGNIIKTLKEHRGIVRDIQLVPSGENFVSASSDDTIKIWSPNGTLLKTLSFGSAQVSGIAASSDLRTFFTAMDDGTLRLWNTAGETFRTIRGLKKIVTNISITADNKIITVNEDNILDVRSMGGSLIGSVNLNKNKVNCFTVSPVDQQIYAGLSDNSIKIWDMSGNPVRTFKAHDNQVTAIAVTPHGRFILSASKDNTLKIWSLGGKVKFVYKDLTNEISSIQVSPDSKYFLTESSDKICRLWSMKGEILCTIDEDISAVCFLPDPGFLAVKDSDDNLSVRNYKGETITNYTDIEEISEMRPVITMKNDKKRGRYIVAKNQDNKMVIFNARSFNYIKLQFSEKSFFFQDNFGYFDCPRDIIKTTKIARGFTLYDLDQYDKLFFRKNVFDYFMMNKILTNRSIETVIDNQYSIIIIEPADRISVHTNSLMLKFTIDKPDIKLKNLYVKVNARKYKFKKYKPLDTDPAGTYQIKINLNHGNNTIYCGYIDAASRLEIKSEKINIINN